MIALVSNSSINQRRRRPSRRYVRRTSSRQPETVTPTNEHLSDGASLTDTNIPEQAPTANNNEKKGKHVTFGVVEVREHPVILGDHPSARGGVPLTIDWEYEQFETLSVVDFDAVREPEHKTSPEMRQREKMRHLRMSSYYRRTLIKELQYSFKEVKEREQEMLKIQRQRKVTKLLLPLENLKENLKGNLGKTNCLGNSKTVPVLIDQPEKHFGKERQAEAGPQYAC